MEKIAIRFYGLPNTGKSTIMKKIKEDFNDVYIFDDDDIVISNFGNAQDILIEEIKKCDKKFFLFDFIYDFKEPLKTNKLFIDNNKLIINCILPNTETRIKVETLNKKNKMILKQMAPNLVNNDYIEVPKIDFTENEILSINGSYDKMDANSIFMYTTYEKLKEYLEKIIDINTIDIINDTNKKIEDIKSVLELEKGLEFKN